MEESTQNADTKTAFEAKANQGPTMRKLNEVPITKQRLLYSLSVTSRMVTAKAKGLSCFERYLNLFTQGCMSITELVKTISNPSFCILVTKISTKLKKFNNHKILRRLNDDKYTLACTEARQKSSKDEQSFSNFVNTIKTEKKFSPSISQTLKQTDWQK